MCCLAPPWANWHLRLYGLAPYKVSLDMFWSPTLVSLLQFLLAALGLCRLWGLWLYWFYLTLHFRHLYQIPFIICSLLAKCQSHREGGNVACWFVGRCGMLMWALLFADTAYSSLTIPSLWCAESTFGSPLGWRSSAFLRQSTKDALWLCDESLQLEVRRSAGKSTHSFCTQRVARQPG